MSEREALRAELARAVDHWGWCWDCGTRRQECDGVARPCCPDCRHRDAVDAQILPVSDPIDWPARFRAAADAAQEHDGSWVGPEAELRSIAHAMEAGYLGPHAVEAIGRALEGR